MRQWYCVVRGQRYGPISEEDLRAWVRDGRLLASDLVWSEGMAQWAPAASIMPEMFPGGAAAGAYGPLAGLVPVAQPGGTGGMTSNGELMSQASAALSGRWGLPIGFSVLMFLIGMGIGLVPYIGGLAQLILQGPLALGGVVFFLTFTRGGLGELGMLFIGFKNFGTALGAFLLVAVFVLGWFLLFSAVGIILLIVLAVASAPVEALIIAGIFCVIPGTIAATVAQLAYSQTMYIVADDSEIGAMAAIRRSKELMRGHKGKLFLMSLLFGLLSILCIFTLFIGFIWLTPYMCCFYARFYDDLQPALQAEGQAELPA